MIERDQIQDGANIPTAEEKQTLKTMHEQGGADLSEYAKKADTVQKTGDQSIAGRKTFSTPPRSTGSVANDNDLISKAQALALMKSSSHWRYGGTFGSGDEDFGDLPSADVDEMTIFICKPPVPTDDGDPQTPLPPRVFTSTTLSGVDFYYGDMALFALGTYWVISSTGVRKIQGKTGEVFLRYDELDGITPPALEHVGLVAFMNSQEVDDGEGGTVTQFFMDYVSIVNHLVAKLDNAGRISLFNKLNPKFFHNVGTVVNATTDQFTFAGVTAEPTVAYQIFEDGVLVNPASYSWTGDTITLTTTSITADAKITLLTLEVR